MYRDKRIVYSSSAALFALLALLFFIPVASSRIAAAVLLAVAAAAIWFLIKKRSILSINKNMVLLIMSFTAFIYISLYYISGFYFGFLKPIYRFNGVNFLRYVLPITVIIIATEIIRSVMLAQKGRFPYILCYLSCIASEALIAANYQSLSTFNQFMDLIGLTVIPAIIANVTYHFIAKRYGAVPNIVYRLMITLYPYIIPLGVDVPESLFSFVKLIIPLFIYWFIGGLFDKKRRYALKRPSKFYYLGIGALAVVMISIVMLISCKFKYGLVVIATESMTGEINKGDAIIYEEYDGGAIEVGQVIVFEKDRSLIIHRVIDVQRINGVTRYYTQGDANPSPDDGYVTKDQIVGLTDIKISYIGYPTIFAREIFKGKAR